MKQNWAERLRASMHHQAESLGNLLVEAFHYLALFAIGATVFWAAGAAFLGMVNKGHASIDDILLLFIYLELGAMVGIYFKTNHMPVRFLIYVAMTALTRLMIADIQHNHTPDDGIILVSVALLLLALAILVVRFASARFRPAQRPGNVLPSPGRVQEACPMKGWKLFTPLLILAIVAITLYLRLHNPPLLLQGEADATNVIVSSKAKGRVQVLHVRRGDEVKQGDLLISLDSPELEAQLDALHAARNQAQAQLDESLHGTREESIRALKASLAQAEAELRNAESDFQRNQQMVERGFLSRTQFDLSRRERDVARDRVAEARANLDEGLKGDREERRQALQAAVRRADAQIAELQAQIDDLQVRAPVNGEVGPIPAEQGELINAYSPLLTLVRLDDSYFVFNLREDILAKVRKGDRIVMQVPGLGGAEVETELRYIAPLGDFSTRRATRATGDFDLKTFETRFYPLQPTPGLRPGMSARWRWTN